MCQRRLPPNRPEPAGSLAPDAVLEGYGSSGALTLFASTTHTNYCLRFWGGLIWRSRQQIPQGDVLPVPHA